MMQDEKPAEAIHAHGDQKDDLRAEIQSLRNDIKDLQASRRLNSIWMGAHDHRFDFEVGKIQETLKKLSQDVSQLGSDVSKLNSDAFESKKSVEQIIAKDLQNEERIKSVGLFLTGVMVGLLIGVMVGMSALYLALH